MAKCKQKEMIANNSKCTGGEETSEKRNTWLPFTLFLLFLGRSFQQLNFE
jgi:hypothetical protein